MLIKIGVIGPEESMTRILQVSKEFKDIELIPFTYQEVSEITDIVTNNDLIVDQWLFSGIMNYSFAVDKKLIKENEGNFPPLHGSSFFGVLMEAQLNERNIFDKISIDTITNDEVSKILSFYNLNSLQYYNAPYEGYNQMSKLEKFHKSLYKSNKTQLAITSIKSTYEKLKKDGVLVYRLTPSFLAVKSTIQLLGERAQANHYENLQMAVIGCKIINDFDRNEPYELFKWRHHEVDIKKHLLYLTENMNGSFVDVGDGLYFIFTTKGEFGNNAENDLFKLMNDFKVRDNLTIGVAIGYGETVSHAEQNVRFGLSQFSIDDKASILVIDDQYSITKKFQNQEGPFLNNKAIDQELMTKFGEGVVSYRDVRRIITYSHNYSKKEFTSQDVSRWLQSTERNGRRILAELENAKVIEKCGTVHLKQRGRPKNVYQFVDSLSFLRVVEK
ncbi:hypothetical protein ACFQ3N_13130 [Virgibacillus byunsanensis]|uniref:Transcriptional regulator n=1 Tax=Virgibacillus byunsanensis TaxID=570945 RepID=A0ABW3LPR5_9BACI